LYFLEALWALQKYFFIGSDFKISILKSPQLSTLISFDQTKDSILPKSVGGGDTGDVHVPGGYNRRTQKEGEGGCHRSIATGLDRGIAGDRPRHFRFCAPVQGTGTYAPLSSDMGFAVITTFDFVRTLAVCRTCA
jgi:hypothetical protein